MIGRLQRAGCRGERVRRTLTGNVDIATGIHRDRGGESAFSPPRKVEYSNRPAGSSLETNTSSAPEAWLVKAPLVAGKSDELVVPVMYAFPDESTAIPFPQSFPLPLDS